MSSLGLQFFLEEHLLKFLQENGIVAYMTHCIREFVLESSIRLHVMDVVWIKKGVLVLFTEDLQEQIDLCPITDTVLVCSEKWDGKGFGQGAILFFVIALFKGWDNGNDDDLFTGWYCVYCI
jgi:hypothetical protein